MCYVNYNIPRTLPMNHCEIKKLIKDGNVQCLEEKLLNGEGYKLIGQYSTNPKIKTFLQSVPIYIARIDMLQDSACKGNLRDMEVLLENGNSSRNIYKIPPVKLVCSKDLNGVTVLHKAVYYDFLDIIEWLVKNYPQTVHIKDKTLRIPLHYICSCSNVSRIWDLMLEAGADPNALDINNNTPSYYLEYSENITLPNNFKNDTLEQDIPIKPSNIRIWIHDRNIKQLAKVIWSGFGDKLLTETSKQATVNKFLKAVPYIMGIIKEIHKAVIEDNLALLKKLNREPVPVEILASKDQNGLTPLHKAVGLGRLSIVDYIISKNSKTVNIRDSDGRTPLHYAFIVEPDNITPIYNKLVKAGANENLIDKKGKTPKGDGTKINDIPINLLTILPKAPRIASEFPASWDWNILYEADEKEKSVIKSKPKVITFIQESETQANLTTSTTKPTNTNGTENINRVQDIDNIENSNNVENVDINNDYVLNSENKKTNNLKLRDENYISLYNQREVQEINDNIDNVDNSNIKESNNPNNKDTNYTTLYTQSELQDINDNIHRSKNEENDDHKNRDTNYTSLNTQTELQDIANIVDLSKNEENNDHKKRDTNYTSLNTQIELEDIDNNFDHKKLQDIEDINNGISKSSSFTLGEVRQAFNNGLLDDMLPLCGPVYRVNGLKDTENVALFDKNETTSRETQEPKNSAHIIVNKGSLDKIADYILDGKHEKLAGIKSDTPAVQDFLDKIPFYVNKIDQIHRYCAIGDLDGLIQVLDRKKFCLARESKSGLGLTPLHTAALYEQLDIFEYLTTKFPETLKLNDFYGRTAMDYAKSMPDNTFLDKLLNIESIFGEFQTDYRTPLNFGKNSVTFKPKEIQKALGYVTEPADEELSDLDMDRSSNNSGKLLSSVISASRFSVEDREYLNKAIGKPLTSGLKDLIKRRPSNPTLFLAEHLTNHYDDPQSDQESGVSLTKMV
ncbi:Hypothetical protein CINCED_3A015088 [Cinara cedri]|uniref:Ankyrin repeat-containing domain,Ankyrin repeat n=1 Tax=Cinara cedri TaxID=506608 RepID=A0A5E4MA44_9HEMI|nr:Hypothetical protein CINCED_3A015088 [Cinara cedri]